MQAQLDRHRRIARTISYLRPNCGRYLLPHYLAPPVDPPASINPLRPAGRKRRLPRLPRNQRTTTTKRKTKSNGKNHLNEAPGRAGRRPFRDAWRRRCDCDSRSHAPESDRETQREREMLCCECSACLLLATSPGGHWKGGVESAGRRCEQQTFTARAAPRLPVGR